MRLPAASAYRAATAVLLASLVAGGCRMGVRPADVAETSRAVADVKKDSTLPRTYLLGSMLDDRAPFPWTGTTMLLARRGPAFHPRARLVVDLVDARGGQSEFTVDTGTSISCCSTYSLAAATATREVSQDCTAFKDGSRACRATLTSLTSAGLSSTKAPVLLVNRPHDLSDSTNLFGMTWLAGLALVHDVAGDRWRLAPGGTIPPRAGWRQIRMEAPALPVVKLVGASGEQVYALIDTGAPTSMVERGTACGRYTLVDSTGGAALSIGATETAPWTGLDPGGRHVTAWIGLDDLDTRSFVMDFATGIWSIAPAEVAPVTRVAPR